MKRSSGRSKGHPEASDCSGNAGMVVVGEDGVGRKDWTASGLGNEGSRGRRVRNRNMNKQRKHVIVVFVKFCFVLANWSR